MKLDRIVCIVLFSFLAALPAHGEVSLFLDSSSLYETPGSTVGWGFTLTSEPITFDGSSIIPYLVVSNVTYVPDPGTDPVGVFTPFITLPQNFAVIGPDDGNGELNPLTQSFDNTAQTGLGSYTINTFQSPGDSTTGTITLSYDQYSVSPYDLSFDPDSDYIGPGSVSVEASVFVTATQTSSVPEPSPALPLTTGAALLYIRRKWKGRRRGR